MVAVDTNILVYAHREEYKEIHTTCVDLLRPLAVTVQVFAFNWQAV
jgi:predicted nucleic acid-binding protein